MSECLIEPVERRIELDLQPARTRENFAACVVSRPAFDKAQLDGAHLGELVEAIVAEGGRLVKERYESARLEYAQRVAGGELVHSVEWRAAHIVAHGRLHEHGRRGQALDVDVAAARLVHVDAHAATDVPPTEAGALGSRRVAHRAEWQMSGGGGE